MQRDGLGGPLYFTGTRDIGESARMPIAASAPCSAFICSTVCKSGASVRDNRDPPAGTSQFERHGGTDGCRCCRR